MATITTKISTDSTTAGKIRNRASTRNNSIMGSDKSASAINLFNKNSAASEKHLNAIANSMNRQEALAWRRYKLELKHQRDEADYRKLQERARRQSRDVTTALKETTSNAKKAFPVLDFFTKLFGPVGALFKGILAAGKLVINSFKLIWTLGSKLVKGGKLLVASFRNMGRVLGSKQTAAAASRLAGMREKGLTIGGEAIGKGAKDLSVVGGAKNIAGVLTSGSKNAAAIRLAGMPGASAGAKALGGVAKYAKIGAGVGTAIMAGADLYGAYKTQQQLNEYGDQLPDKEKRQLQNRRNSQIGGAVGASAGAALGSIFGPIGTKVGGMIGKAFGEWIGKNFKKIRIYIASALDWIWNNNPIVKLFRRIFDSKEEREELNKEYEERRKKRQIELEKEREALDEDDQNAESESELDKKLEAFGLSEKKLKEISQPKRAVGVNWDKDITESQIGTQHFQNRYKSANMWSSDRGAYVTNDTKTYEGTTAWGGTRTIGGPRKKPVAPAQVQNLQNKVFTPVQYNTNYTPATREAAVEKAVLERKNEVAEAYNQGLIDNMTYLADEILQRTSTQTAQGLTNQTVNMWGYSPASVGNAATNNMSPIAVSGG